MHHWHTVCNLNLKFYNGRKHGYEGFLVISLYYVIVLLFQWHQLFIPNLLIPEAVFWVAFLTFWTVASTRIVHFLWKWSFFSHMVIFFFCNANSWTIHAILVSNSSVTFALELCLTFVFNSTFSSRNFFLILILYFPLNQSSLIHQYFNPSWG